MKRCVSVSKVKCLVLGLDGATFSLLGPLSEEGKLPSIRRLMIEGVKGILKSTIPPLSSVAWTSFATGKNPGKHGVFDFSKRATMTYEDSPVTSRDVRCETLWDILSRHRRRVGLVNVPLTYPPKAINGMMVTGFPTPEEMGDYTYPRDLLRELKADIPGYRLQPVTPLLEGNEEALATDLGFVTENILQTTLRLLEKGDWDLLATVFTGPDAMGHICWNHIDPSHPLHDEVKSSRLGPLFSEMYSMIDRAVGRILGSVDELGNVLLLSDHGFAGVHKAVYINNWLLEEGLLKVKRGIPSMARYGALRLGLTPVRAYGLARRFHLLRNSLRTSGGSRSRLQSLASHIFLSRSDIDWRRSRAYSFGSFGQMCVNLAGRDPEGIVSEGNCNGLVSGIMKDLSDMKDPDTGEQLFDMIYSRDQIYWGPESQSSPDIVFLNSRSKFVTVRYLEFGDSKLLARHPVWTGAHAMDGVFIACGTDMNRGAEIESASIMDVAPTILHLLNCPAPNDVDGKVLNRIFRAGSEAEARGVVYENRELDRAIERLKTAGRI